ncbi:MAG: RNA polymerase sigma factor [Myxococcota bacterium]
MSTGPIPDAVLVAAARSGDRKALEALFRRHAPRANGLAHRLLGGSGVDDLVQDAFLVAFRDLQQLQDPSKFGPWLAGIVARTAAKRIRRLAIGRRLGLLGSNMMDPNDLVSDAAPPTVRLELLEVYRIFHRLPTDVRVAFILHRVEGMTLDETAEAVGCSRATVKRRVRAVSERLERLRRS